MPPILPPQPYTTAFVTLATPALAVLVRFYQAFLQQEPEVYVPGVYAEFGLGSLRLAIFQPKAQNQPEFAQPAGAALSLCLEVPQLEGAIAHFQAVYADIPELQPPTPRLSAIFSASHGREVYAYDPDGNRLILHQSPPASPAAFSPEPSL